MPAVVSVVIPVYNGLPYLEQALNSVLNQTHAELDILLVDGGSTDGSCEWIQGVTDPRVRMDMLPPGTSAAENWTYATRLARGDFVKLLCQDDLLFTGTIARQVADLQAHAECELTIGTRDIISASGKTLNRSRGLNGVSSGVVTGEELLRASYLAGTNVIGEPHTVLFRREVIQSAMPWEGARPYLLDLDTYAKVLRQTGCTALIDRESTGAFRLSTSSWSTRLIEAQQAQIRTWQQEYEQAHAVSSADRARARLAAARQAITRRAAYAYLKARGDFS